jgi:hypothetical protein
MQMDLSSFSKEDLEHLEAEVRAELSFRLIEAKRFYDPIISF